MGGIDLDLQGHLAISTHKTAFNVALYTDLGRPRGATRSKRALVHLCHKHHLKDTNKSKKKHVGLKLESGLSNK